MTINRALRAGFLCQILNEIFRFNRHHASPVAGSAAAVSCRKARWNVMRTTPSLVLNRCAVARTEAPSIARARTTAC